MIFNQLMLKAPIPTKEQKLSRKEFSRYLDGWLLRKNKYHKYIEAGVPD